MPTAVARVALLAAFLSAAPAALAAPRRRGPASSPSSSSGHSSSGSSSSGCTVRLAVNNAFSRLDVNGALNGHGIELERHEEVRPVGSVQLASSAPCPTTEADLADPFTFAISSPTPVAIEPTEFTVKASKVVNIHVQDLQLELSTSSPIHVDGGEFSTSTGLHMKVTHGKATALGHDFSLSGFEANVPFNGYFGYDEFTGELTLHIIDFDANFRVHNADPWIDGNFEVTGWMTVLGTPPGAGHHLAAEAAPRGADSIPAALRARAQVTSATVAALAMAAVLIAALAALAAPRIRARAMGAEGGAGLLVARTGSGGVAPQPSDAAEHVAPADRAPGASAEP